MLRNPRQINKEDLHNVRKKLADISRVKREYLKGKIDELEIDTRNRNVSEFTNTQLLKQEADLPSVYG
jgi:hypothetical protein